MHVEVTARGPSITCRVYTGLVRPTRPSGTATDPSAAAGYCGFVLANGREATPRTWHANNWFVA